MTTFELEDSNEIGCLDDLLAKFPNNTKIEMTEKCWQFAAGLLAGCNAGCTFIQRTADGTENVITYDAMFE